MPYEREWCRRCGHPLPERKRGQSKVGYKLHGQIVCGDCWKKPRPSIGVVLSGETR
jgi:hypothetical protein